MTLSKTLEIYIDDLDQVDSRKKIKALKKLGEAGPTISYAVSKIIPLLNDSVWEVRAQAAYTIGLVGSEAKPAIPFLINVLADQYASVRCNAIFALGMIEKNTNPISPVIPKLREALHDSKWCVRSAAIHALGSAGASAAVSALSDLIKCLSVAETYTERDCIWWLVKAILANNPKEIIAQHINISDIPEAPPFFNRLTNRVTEKKLPRKITIEKHIWDLQDNDGGKRLAAIKKLYNVIELIIPERENLYLQIVPNLIPLLNDNSWKIRRYTARLLGRMGPFAEEAIPYLTVALQDQMATVREQAADALMLLGEKAKPSMHIPESIQISPPTADAFVGCSANGDFTMSAYQIFEQNGKYGLFYQPFPDEPGEVFLDSVYDSLQIESDYFDLEHFYAISDETKLSRPDIEHNCAIVIADRRAGLVIGKKIVVEFKYQRIIKLTFCHYLCKDNAAYTLYHHRGYEQPSDDWVEGLFPIATISIEGELTLDNFLRTLSESHPDVSIALSTKLFKDPDSHTYISEYRYYYEWWRGSAIFMPVGIHRVIIENDFQIRPLGGLVNPSSKALE